MGRLITAWRWLRTNWKAALAGVPVLLVVVYTALSNHNRKKSIDAKRKANEAQQNKTEAVSDADHLQHTAAAHGHKARSHQERASAVVERLRKKEQKRPSLAAARELAERFNRRGKE